MDKIFHYYIPLIFDLSKAYGLTALVTAIVETIFFGMIKYNKKNFLSFVFAVNIVTNLTLNIALSIIPKTTINISVAEIAVVVAEFLAFNSYLKLNSKKSFRLFIMTIFSNLISYSTGLIFYNFKNFL